MKRWLTGKKISSITSRLSYTNAAVEGGITELKHFKEDFIFTEGIYREGIVARKSIVWKCVLLINSKLVTYSEALNLKEHVRCTPFITKQSDGECMGHVFSYSYRIDMYR
ncbi:hypothetical protein CAI16_15130 [Virgibacillus dokdonensis]|uniref:Uncharacterized protein n=1 Tax=Virgibacillus dokdonensis TaxID=302167 RepID=A0A3E0WMA4_9BACI|nr:hypothetical protein CAI16_15130 [Virgibacillus dokdonensis]